MKMLISRILSWINEMQCSMCTVYTFSSTVPVSTYNNVSLRKE